MKPAVFRLNPILIAFGLASLPAMAAQQNADETMVITATQTKHTELSAPASVSVITRAELDKRSVMDLTDALKTVPGVSFIPSSPNGRYEIKLRGMGGKYALLLLNGRRLNAREVMEDNYGNDFDIASIPVAAIERIEILRGPASSLYGSDAMAGVINVITRTPGNKTEGSLGYDYRNITSGKGGDLNKGSGYLSGALVDDKLFSSLMVEKYNRDAWQSGSTWTDAVDQIENKDKLSLISNSRLQLNEQQSLDLDLFYLDDERNAQFSNASFRKGVMTNILESKRQRGILTHNGSWDAFDSQLSYTNEHVELVNNSQGIVAQYGGNIPHITQSNQTLNAQATTTLLSHTLVAGGEYQFTELEHSEALKQGAAEVKQSALYLQDEFSIADVSVTLGGRLDHHDKFGTEFNPKGYLNYAISDAWMVKGGVGRSYKAPTLRELDPNYLTSSSGGSTVNTGNPDLQPETAVTYELGTSYELNNWGAGVTLFRNDIKNRITVPSSTTLVKVYHNAGEAAIKGVEFSAWYDLTDSLHFNGNVTALRSEDVATGQELEKTPEHSAYAGLNWQATSTLSAQLDWNYTGSQVVPVPRIVNKRPKAVSLDSAAFQTVDLGIKWNAMPALDLKLGMTNLFDEERDEIAHEAILEIEGRAVYAGLEYKL